MKKQIVIPLVLILTIILIILSCVVVFNVDLKITTSKNQDETLNLDEKEIKGDIEIIEDAEEFDKTNVVEEQQVVESSNEEIVESNSSINTSETNKNNNSSNVNTNKSATNNSNNTSNSIPNSGTNSSNSNDINNETQIKEEETDGKNENETITSNSSTNEQVVEYNTGEVVKDDTYYQLKKSTFETERACLDKGIEVSYTDVINILGSYCESVSYKGNVIGYKLYIKYASGEMKRYEW